MYNHKIPHRQLTAWLASALIPTAIQLTGGASWFSVLLVCVLSLLFVWLRWAFGTEPKGKLILVFQWLLLVAVLGMACRASAESWPRGGHRAVGIILLILAVWSTGKGPSASARVSCVLFWFVLMIYLVLLGAGVKNIQIKWLIPTSGDVDGFGCVLLLTPAAAAIHLDKKVTVRHRLLLIGVFCTVAAVVTAGVLSPQVAAQKHYAFYEMTRSLNLLGQARRFEAILSACTTLGWFSLLSMYLSLCAQLANCFHAGYGKWGSLTAAVLAAAFLLCDLHIPGWVLLILVSVFWVLVPIITQGLGLKKKS